MQIQENISLLPYNTFGFDVKARYFVSITSEDQLREILSSSEWQHIPKLIVGGGSNILLTNHVHALVIHIEIKGIEVVEEDSEHVVVRSGAGENWHAFVLHCVENGYAGVENLSLIPGTVGAAPMQNIGAYGVEIKDVFDHLEAVEIKTGKLRIFTAEQCAFGYRESVFKRSLKDQFIITAVSFRLSKNPEFRVSYGDIRQTLEEMQVQELSLSTLSAAVCKIRQSKLPDPKELGNAGSFFKNPEIPNENFAALKERFPTLPGYPTSPNQTKVPAGWLIEQAGWKGFREGPVGVHARQALVLVHYGEGRGEQILALSRQIQASVYDKFGILLTPEVNVI